MRRVFAIVVTLVLVMFVAGDASAADNESNDRILRGDGNEYIEVFKKDSANGKKNYLYTITEFKDKWGRDCTVVSGNSEQTIALDCDRASG